MSGQRILVVDDDLHIRRLLQATLTRGGYTPIEATTAAEALEQARAANPDAILLDLGLPDLHGREVLHRLKSDPETSRIPVVVITSSVLSDAEQRGIETLAAGVLQKDSLSRDRAIAAVEKAVRSAESA